MSMEEGPLAWVLQKLANAAGWLAAPFLALESRLDEAAFRATKRRERREKLISTSWELEAERDRLRAERAVVEVMLKDAESVLNRQDGELP